MGDDKAKYSKASKEFVEDTIKNSQIDLDRYNRSKNREAIYNEIWKNQMVDLNDIVWTFTPGAIGSVHGVKYEFENDHYVIKADMAAGYLRIYDKHLKKYVKLDGTPGSLEETHFKIKKRSEM